MLTRLNRFLTMCHEDGQYAGDAEPIFRTRSGERHDRFSGTALKAGGVTSRMRDMLEHTDAYDGETSRSFRRGGMQARQDAGEEVATTMSGAHVF
jgi:hypothetical protein